MRCCSHNSMLKENGMRTFDFAQIYPWGAKHYPDVLERFVSKIGIIRTEQGCLEWKAAKLESGYGQFYWMLENKNLRLAHIAAFVFAYGPLFERCVLHECDNKPCVWPGHLMNGSHADNMHDLSYKGLTTLGIRNANAKLDNTNVRAIRLLAARGLLQKDIAKKVGMSTNAVHSVLQRKTWRHVK